MTTTIPCTAVVYPSGEAELCGAPADELWLHVNPDDSRAIDHEYVGDRTYTDHYPSGKPYTACGMPHPTPSRRGPIEEDVARRCSRLAGHDSPEWVHSGRADLHMNDLGNAWTWAR